MNIPEGCRSKDTTSFGAAPRPRGHFFPKGKRQRRIRKPFTRKGGLVQIRVTLAPGQVGAGSGFPQRRSARIGPPKDPPKCYPKSGVFEPCRKGGPSQRIVLGGDGRAATGPCHLGRRLPRPDRSVATLDRRPH